MRGVNVDGVALQSRQYVAFWIAGELYAMDISFVQRITKAPQITKVPLVPTYVEGLTNLRGTVIPVINLATLLGLRSRDVSESSRMIVVEDGSSCHGYLVEGVWQVLSIASDQIRPVAAGEDGRTSLLEGVAKLEGTERLVMVVNPVALNRTLASSRKDVPGAEMSYASGTCAHGGDGQSESIGSGEGQEIQLVTFRVGSEEYALEINAVQEIEHFPEYISCIPTTRAYVLGAMNLRDQVLPVVSMPALLGIDQHRTSEFGRVVVANLTGDNGGSLLVSLAVDSVQEVLRVRKSAIEPVPPVLSESCGQSICGICKLNEGERLVYLLDKKALLDSLDVSLLSDGAVQATEQQERKVASDSELQLVTFKLGEEEFGLEVTNVQEIIKTSTVVRIPRAPEFVEGVINLRGTVIPVISLRKRFGLNCKGRDESSRVVVVRREGVLFGLVVDSVREVMKAHGSQIEKPSDVICESLDHRFVRGIVKSDDGRRLIILLDLNQVLSF